MAPGIAVFGTSCGTIDSHAGVLTDQAALSTNVVKSKRTGDTKSSATTAAKIAINATIAYETAMIIRRGSTMSAIAPAGSVNRKIGSVVAVCSSETSNALRSNVVINQPDAVSYMAMPM